MKKNILSFILIILPAVLFAQNDAYKKHFTRAQAFEKNYQYVQALGAYYDAMEADPTSAAEPALKAFDRLSEKIKSGNLEFPEDKNSVGPNSIWDHIYNDWNEYKKENSLLFKVGMGKRLENRSKSYGSKSSPLSRRYIHSVLVYDNQKNSIIRNILKDSFRELGNYWDSMDKFSDEICEISFMVTDGTGNELLPIKSAPFYPSNDRTYEEYYPHVEWETDSDTVIKVITAEDYKIVPVKVVVNGKAVPIESVQFLDNINKPVEENVLDKVRKACFNQYVTVQGGSFQMGSPDSGSDAKTVHSVTVSTFMIGKTEVTKELYESVMGKDSLKTYVDWNDPASNVSWYNAVEFCNALSKKDGLTPCYSKDSSGNWLWNKNANGWRLPTEAEWEFAARGGNLSKGTKYSGSDDIDEIAWYFRNSNVIETVATKVPNELGLYDMSGNVWEWCWDWYGAYSSGSQKNPTGPSYGSSRVIRGGGVYTREEELTYRVSYRNLCLPSNSNLNIGFRIVRSVK